MAFAVARRRHLGTFEPQPVVQILPYWLRELLACGLAPRSVHFGELAFQAPDLRHSPQDLVGDVAATAGLDQFVELAPGVRKTTCPDASMSSSSLMSSPTRTMGRPQPCIGQLGSPARAGGPRAASPRATPGAPWLALGFTALGVLVVSPLLPFSCSSWARRWAPSSGVVSSNSLRCSELMASVSAERPVLQAGELKGDLAQLGFLELDLARLPLDVFVALDDLAIALLDLVLMLLQARVLLANLLQHASGQRVNAVLRSGLASQVT